MKGKYVITGGPGVGKSTVIKLLSEKGYMTVSETARTVIEGNLEKKSDVLPWKDWQEFQKEVCAKQLSIEENLPKDKIVFLDRGYLDSFAYLKLHGGKASAELLKLKPKYDKVFILEPLGDFKKDKCRKEDKETALKIHELIKEAYAEYDVASIPAVSPEERVSMILKSINTKLA